eukprot:5080997-Karenia_brevis.AAC.1
MSVEEDEKKNNMGDGQEKGPKMKAKSGDAILSGTDDPGGDTFQDIKAVKAVADEAARKAKEEKQAKKSIGG